MDQISEKLEALSKYVPFIDFIIERNVENCEKFKLIKTWIIAKKRYPMRDLEKLEQAIFVQFRKLFLENVKVPIEIANIFKRTPGEIMCINLCSDEEEDNDDDTLISVLPTLPILSGATNTDIKPDTSEILFQRRGDFRPEIKDTNLQDMNLDELQECMQNSIDASNIPIDTFVSVLQNCVSSGESDAVKTHSAAEKNYGRVPEQEFPRQVTPNHYKINPKDPRLQKMLERQRSISLEGSSEAASSIDSCNLKSNDIPQNSNDMHLLMHTLMPHDDTVSSEKSRLSADEGNAKERSNIPQTNASKVNRILKQLECTVTGFTNQSAAPIFVERQAAKTAYIAISDQYRKRPLSGCENDYSQGNRENETPQQIGTQSRCSTRDNHEEREFIRDIDEANGLERGTAKAIRLKRRCSIISDQLSDQLAQEYRPKQEDAAPLKSSVTELLHGTGKNLDPVVRIKSLSERAVLAYTKPRLTKLSCDDCVPELLVTSEKCVYESPQHMTKTSKLRIKRRNTDAKMTERNTRFCVLCKSRPHNITNHYIRSHKTESYVSRFRSHELNELVMNTPLAVAVSTCGRITKKYKMTCSFCNVELIDTFPNFYPHISAHTGEYAFQCTSCKFQKPYRADIQSHQLHSKGCRNSRILTLYQYQPNITAIYIYYCNICHFVQINEANVVKHVLEQHDIRHTSAEYVRKFTLVAIHIEDAQQDQTVQTASPALSATVDDDVVLDDIAEDLDQLFDVLKSDCGVVVGNESDALVEAVPTTITTHIPFTAIHCNPLPTEQTTKREDQFEHRPIVAQIDVKPDLVELQKALNNEEINMRIQYRAFPADTHYFGLFKCMASDCFYSTDLSDDMLQHFQEHTESESPPSDMMNCAYCPTGDEYATVQLLVDHIYHCHKYSRYQCPKCCYRSLAAGNVVTHCQLIHTEFLPGDVVVYECWGKMTSVDHRLPKMMLHMSEKVTQLRCGYCTYKSFAIESLIRHIRSAHPSASAMDQELYPQYTCLYCGSDGHNKNYMQEHLAMQHPDEYAIACERILKRGLEFCDAVENLQLTNLEVLPPRIIEMQKWTVDSNANLTTQMPVLVAANSTAQERKPDLSELLQINVEIVKSLLLKLTGETGISPDLLYCCSHTECGRFFRVYSLWARHMSLRHHSLLAMCPHCREGPIELSNFVTHFEQHRRHLYVCFHCDNTFVSEMALNRHGTWAHGEIAPFRVEQITVSLTYSYGVLITMKLHPDRLEFLLQLQKVLQQHLRMRAEMKIRILLKKWPVSTTEPWLEEYPSYNLQRVDGCLMKNCSFRAQTDASLFQHLRSRHPIAPQIFECYKCDGRIRNQNWDQIIEHLQLHTSSIYVCCACSYSRSDRREVSQHIRTIHAARDVPLLSLLRSTTETSVALGVVFATRKRTFSTLTKCFCCSESSMNSPILARHLKQVHDFEMCYFCEICNKLITDLNSVDEHYAIAHTTESIRLSCQFGLDRGALSIVTVLPLCINITKGISDTTKKRRHNDQLASEVEAKRPSIDVDRIKMERVEPDDDVILLEHDDVVIDTELKACKSAEDRQAKGFQIKCVNALNLLQPIAVPNLVADSALPILRGQSETSIERTVPKNIKMTLNSQRNGQQAQNSGMRNITPPTSSTYAFIGFLPNKSMNQQ